MALPADLRVVCRRLASTDPEELPRLCPVLVNQLTRCGAILSAPHETKTKDKSSDAAVLVHKLKTQINTLLNGRSHNGRFAAVVLIKAIVDVGGWECLRLSGPWVQGLLSIIQRPGHTATKELSIVTVTRIYTLLHGYQTLVREIVTPTLPSFAAACLQLIKPPASGQPLNLPATVIETVVNALTTLIPLYPTTLRPFSAQIRAAVRGYVAPTLSNDAIVLQTLRHASRRLLISLHHSAPKDKHSSDWQKAMDAFIRDCHITADQVFRGVHESWESTAGYVSGTMAYDGEPHGGGADAQEFPVWSGVQAGADRLVGLLELVAACFTSPTKSPVSIPLGSLMDLVTRLAMITQPAAGKEDRAQTNAAIGREEKDELWSTLPSIHVAVLELLVSMVNRLGDSLLPLSRDMLDHMVRIFKSVNQIPSARKTVYTLATELLALAGPTLDKLAVDSLTTLVQACCRDLLDASGYIQDTQKPVESAKLTPGSKKPQAAGNADAFLNPKAGENTASKPHYSKAHLESAENLLTSFLSTIPQSHLSPDSRGLLDRTAILSKSKRAMLASVLHPYQDSNGRYYASIVPFLMRQFSRDQEVEVLRANLRAPKGGAASTSNEMWGEPSTGLDNLLKEPTAEEPVQTFGGGAWEEGRKDEVMDEDEEEEKQPALTSFVPHNAMEVDTEIAIKSFGGMTSVKETVVAVPTPMSPLKRKGEELQGGSAKRVESQPPVAEKAEHGEGEDSDSDAGSIQIDMTMDDDEDDEDEDGVAE